MANRRVRIAWVLGIAGLTGLTTQGCLYKKHSGPGTNIGSGVSPEDEGDLPPPGTPAAQLR